jgi:predicted nucleotidyltransferase
MTAMGRRDDTLAKLGAVAPELRARYGVASLAIFGSVARGEDRPGSDVDLLVTFNPAAHVILLTLGAIASQLEATLGCRVDLLEDHRRLRPSFRVAIERDLCRVA